MCALSVTEMKEDDVCALSVTEMKGRGCECSGRDRDEEKRWRKYLLARWVSV